jgi:hypothetical protein
MSSTEEKTSSIPFAAWKAPSKEAIQRLKQMTGQMLFSHYMQDRCVIQLLPTQQQQQQPLLDGSNSNSDPLKVEDNMLLDLPPSPRS